VTGTEISAGSLRGLIDDRATLRRIYLGDECIIYRVCGVLRDENWGTPEPDTVLCEETASLLRFESDYHRAGYGLRTTTTFEIAPDRVRIVYRASVNEPFLRNRLGLCVLLPGSLAGHEYLRHDGHEDRESKLLRFPKRIAPYQLCTNIGGLEYSLGDVTVSVRFFGDVFEMEDQRNWTDFSFKIYSTPLSEPFPVRLNSGDVLQQVAEISTRFADTPSPFRKSAQRPDSLGKGSVVAAHMPRIGTRLNPSTAGKGFCLPVDYYRLDLPSGKASFGASDLPLHLYQWNEMDAKSQHSVDPRIERTAAANPTDATVGSDAFARFSDSNRLVGTDAAFAQLNRERPAGGVHDTIVFTASPQVHDHDDETVLDNLFGLREVMRSAYAIYPSRPIGIGILELTPHFNPAAGDLETNTALRRIDTRMSRGFALAWSFAALCELAAGKAEFVTLFDFAGVYGFLDGEKLSPAVLLLNDLADAGIIGPASQQQARCEATLRLPVARVGSDRRYVMGCDGSISPGASRSSIFIAANLSASDWSVSPTDLAAMVAREIEPGRRWSVRVVEQNDTGWRAIDDGWFPPADWPERLVDVGDELVIPSISYVRLLEAV
jgi:D-apionolactonase